MMDDEDAYRRMMAAGSMRENYAMFNPGVPDHHANFGLRPHGDGTGYVMGNRNESASYAIGGHGNTATYAMGGHSVGESSNYSLGPGSDAGNYGMSGQGPMQNYGHSGQGDGVNYPLGGRNDIPNYAMGQQPHGDMTNFANYPMGNYAMGYRGDGSTLGYVADNTASIGARTDNAAPMSYPGDSVGYHGDSVPMSTSISGSVGDNTSYALVGQGENVNYPQEQRGGNNTNFPGVDTCSKSNSSALIGQTGDMAATFSGGFHGNSGRIDEAGGGNVGGVVGSGVSGVGGSGVSGVGGSGVQSGVLGESVRQGATYQRDELAEQVPDKPVLKLTAESGKVEPERVEESMEEGEEVDDEEEEEEEEEDDSEEGKESGVTKGGSGDNVSEQHLNDMTKGGDQKKGVGDVEDEGEDDTVDTVSSSDSGVLYQEERISVRDLARKKETMNNDEGGVNSVKVDVEVEEVDELKETVATKIDDSKDSRDDYDENIVIKQEIVEEDEEIVLDGEEVDPEDDDEALDDELNDPSDHVDKNNEKMSTEVRKVEKLKIKITAPKLNKTESKGRKSDKQAAKSSRKAKQLIDDDDEGTVKVEKEAGEGASAASDVNDKEFPFKCQVCDAAFTHQTHLRIHASIHDIDSSILSCLNERLQNQDGSSGLSGSGSNMAKVPNGDLNSEKKFEAIKSPGVPESGKKAGSKRKSSCPKRAIKANSQILNSEDGNASNTLTNNGKTDESVVGASQAKRTIPITQFPAENIIVPVTNPTPIMELSLPEYIQSKIRSRIPPNNPHKCDVCGKSYTLPSNLKRHKRTHEGDYPFVCMYCDKKYLSAGDLEVHQRVHTGERPFECEICGKAYTCARSLATHHKVAHTGERPYKCGQCEKTFARLSNLRSHMKTHTGESPWECQICKRRFTQNYSLQKHIRIHTGERPYACEVCEKGFKCIDDLKAHMRVHTGERPYKCHVCERSFTRSSSLKEHLIYHSGEPSFDCEICYKKFAFKSALTRHMRKHDPDTPFNCEDCGSVFLQPKGLRSHLRKLKCERCEAGLPPLPPETDPSETNSQPRTEEEIKRDIMKKVANVFPKLVYADADAAAQAAALMAEAELYRLTAEQQNKEREQMQQAELKKKKKKKKKGDSDTDDEEEDMNIDNSMNSDILKMNDIKPSDIQTRASTKRKSLIAVNSDTQSSSTAAAASAAAADDDDGDIDDDEYGEDTDTDTDARIESLKAEVRRANKGLEKLKSEVGQTEVGTSSS